MVGTKTSGKLVQFETDERKFHNRLNRPSLFHKIRIINPGNKCGETYAITIPTFIAMKFIECQMKISSSGTTIIIESGCRIQ